MYTIFINDVVIYLTDNSDFKKKNYFFNYRENSISEILAKLGSLVGSSLYVYHPELDFLWQDFKDCFKVIEAAGGVVFNEKEEVLWIYRNNRWDLPKGKIEKGESKEIAAIREVEEECGISNLILKEYRKTTYHIYEYKGEKVLKITYWYDMNARGNQLLKPQLEEGITKVTWLNEMAMIEAKKDTYDNIKLLLQ